MSRADFTEEQLKAAVTAYAEALLEAKEAEAADNSAYELSEHFNVRMLENIELARSIEAAEYRKAARRRFKRSAVAVLIVLVLSFSMVMVFSTEVRAAVSSWTVSTYDKIVHYQFNRAEDNHAFIICSPGSLPEGFVRTEKYRNDYYSRNVYKNAETGEYIKFEYFKPTEKQIAKIEQTGDSSEKYYVFDYYEMYYTQSGEKNKVCWYDPDRNLAFYAESNTEKEVLINTFNTVDFRLPRYEATWVPEGCVPGELTDLLLEYSVDYYNDQDEFVFNLDYIDMAEADLIWISKGAGESMDEIVYEDINIKGNSGRYYPPSDNDIGSELILINDKDKLVFLIEGILSKEDIIHFAESIECIETDW